jgi:putative sugar O-methyltransferase
MTKQSSLSENNQYNSFCLDASKNDSIFSTFKQNPIYNEILEHLSFSLGHEYYEITKTYYPNAISQIEKIKINDSYGSPRLNNYYFGTYSATTLRYLKVAAELQHCFFDIKNYNILEIGGGYGGQAIVSKIVHDYKSWTIVDLPEVVELQKKYLNNFNYSDVQSMSYLDNYFENKYDLIISNYAFTECNRDVELDYINKVMSNNEKIYITANFINTKNLNFQNMLSLKEMQDILKIKTYPEIPITSNTNAIVMRGNDREPYSK